MIEIELLALRPGFGWVPETRPWVWIRRTYCAVQTSERGSLNGCSSRRDIGLTGIVGRGSIESTRISVLSAYPFHMFEQAKQMERLGALERLVTAVPKWRTGVSGSRVRTRLGMSTTRYVVRRVLPRSDHFLSRQVVRVFDGWSAGQLGNANVVSALSGFATTALERSASQGVATCCDRGSWHILEQKEVLDAEAVRVGIPPVYFDPYMVDRELREYALVDRIVVPSEPARLSFIRRGIEPSKVVKVPYGVDVSAFTPEHGERQPGAIVSVAAVGLTKGQRYLLDAFRSLRSARASLTLVGPVDPGWAAQLDLDRGDVRVIGAVARARVIEELQRGSIFVLASLLDGFGLVIAQAMACGLPVIATEATGVRELVDDGVEGFVVPAGDSRSLAEAMTVLLDDPVRAAEMGRAGRARVESLGGWDEYGLRLLQVFDGARAEHA